MTYRRAFLAILARGATDSSARSVVRSGARGDAAGGGAGLSVGVRLGGAGRNSPPRASRSRRWFCSVRFPGRRFVWRFLCTSGYVGAGGHVRHLSACSARGDARSRHIRHPSVSGRHRSDRSEPGRTQPAGRSLSFLRSSHLIPARRWAGRVCTPCMRCLDRWRCRARGSAAYYRATRRTQ